MTEEQIVKKIMWSLDSDEKVIEKGTKLIQDFAKEYHKKQLRIGGVSQQRELLNALADKFNESTHTYVGQPMIEETLKAFNCG